VSLRRTVTSFDGAFRTSHTSFASHRWTSCDSAVSFPPINDSRLSLPSSYVHAQRRNHRNCHGSIRDRRRHAAPLDPMDHQKSVPLRVLLYS
jgi:hypothetical protein